MKNFKGRMIVIALVVVALAAASIPLLPRAAIRIFEEAYKLDVRYERLEKASPKRFVFKGLTVTDRILGIGTFSEHAVISLAANGPDPRRAMLAFDMTGVRFVKTKAEKPPAYNSLDGLVELPFGSGRTYGKISGKVGLMNGDVTLKDFLAAGDDMKLAVDGTVTSDKKIDATIKIYFAESLTKLVPPELTAMALGSEGGGWRSLSVKLEGDYDAPRIRVSSKLFRLSIGVKQ